ncbi:trypsin-like serine protease [Alphaproteobacteria bacterium GH1-50]|uniref:Trypsin-like serine protease n=1 Tax=Kangsaoukella pontilimi TaxID=2691042 RepID=A0A7C9IQS0_9RHOB|nr:trypsin-like serine protease [Kangsaoukella pontilimi]MXQ06626.1 trypsin-like serine protease [Kangsaoukella pontilimi]
MRRFLTAALAALFFGVPAAAQAEEASSLTTLMTAYEARGWEGVGRLNIGRSGMCTGALVAPDLVLTAAHCIYDRSGDLVAPNEIQFLAGWRNGRASAYRGVRRAIAHPSYEYTGPESDLRVANDIALLKLDSPIRLANVQPFATADRPRKGSSVGVVSYAHDRADTPSLQEVCHVLARQSGSLILSCDVDFGSSGAPIFTEVAGEPRIVSVVSAKAMIRGRPVSIGTNLERPLAELMEMMNTPGTASAVAVTTARRVVPGRIGSGLTGGGGGLNSGGGAKFLKP